MKTIKLAALALSALVPFQSFADLSIERTSGNGTYASESQAISSDGEFQAFSSLDPFLDVGFTDSNGVADIYLRDLITSGVQCVSVTNVGVVGNGASTNPSISENGHYIAFQSAANNFVPAGGDSNGKIDIFVYDLFSSTIKRVSLTPNGGQAQLDCVNPSISADGSTVAFVSADANLFEPTLGATSYIYVVKRQNAGTYGSLERVPLPHAPGATSKACYNPSISRDGNFVAYEYFVTKSAEYSYQDIYVYNLTTHQNTRITGSFATDGVDWNGMISGNPSISGDGKSVAFDSCAKLTSEKEDLDPIEVNPDVYVAQIGESISYRLVSKDAAGHLGNASSIDPALSENGRFVTFQSEADNFDQGSNNDSPTIYRKELATGELKIVANTFEPDGASFVSAISADGRVVSFISGASNLIDGISQLNYFNQAFVADFDKAPAVLAFKEDSGATPIVDVTGNYTGNFPRTQHPYSADAAMDESGKIVTMGRVEGYSHPTKGPEVRMKGTVKTVNNEPTVSGSGNVKGGTLDGEPVSGTGKITVPLVESTTEGGSGFNSAVGSGSGSRDGQRFKSPATVVSIPAKPGAGNKDWSLKLNIFETSNPTDSHGTLYLAATATLYLPNGDRTQFKERKLTFNKKTGLYSTKFSNGIKVDENLEPILVKGKPVVDRKSQIQVSEMAVEATGTPRLPTDGLLKYKFLGQKGSGDLLDFL